MKTTTSPQRTKLRASRQHRAPRAPVHGNGHGTDQGNGSGATPALAAWLAQPKQNLIRGQRTPTERGKLLWRIGDVILEHADELAELESLDNGKPRAVARVADVPLAADLFHYMAGWATKIEGSTIPISVPYAAGARFHAFTLREPVGVVGQIIPWNFPLLMAAWKLGPAL